MPSARNGGRLLGYKVLSAAGLALVVHDWCYPGRRTALPGFSLLIIGAVGAAVRPERRECSTSQRALAARSEQEGERGPVRRGERSDQERRAAERTRIYAEAVAETLHALKYGGLHVEASSPDLKSQ